MRDQSAKASALFSPAQLTLARKTCGFTKVQLAKLAGLTPTSIAFFESGESKPSPETISRLAEALLFPVAFFSHEAEIFDDTADTIRPFFRSLRKTSQLERDRATGRARLIYRLSQSLDEYVDFPKPAIPRFHLDGDPTRIEVERVAEKVRAKWGLGGEPIPHMVRLLESKGVLVVRQHLDNPEMSAFSYRFGKRSLVLLGDDIDDAARSRFNAAHELGHLVMHADDCIGTSTVERQANWFASAFLMPRVSFLETFPAKLNWSNLGEMKRFWKVSMAAILYRGHTLGRLSDTAYQRFVMRMSSLGWRTVEPMRLQTTETPVMLTKAVEALQDEPELLEKAIGRVCLPAELLDSVLSPKKQKRRLNLE